MDYCTAIENGIERGCRDNTGGILEFYVATYPESVYFDIDPTSNKVLGIFDKDGTGNANIDFFKFKPTKNSSDFVEVPQTSVENNTVGFEQKATMTFSKLSQEKAETLYKMAYQDAIIIVKDKNENFFLLGKIDGMALSGGAGAGTGKVGTDLNGYAFEFTANENSFAPEVGLSPTVTGTGATATYTWGTPTA